MTKNLLFHTTIVLKQGRLDLRLIEEASGIKIERDLTESRGGRQTQVFCFDTLEELQRFLKADPYHENHQARFEQIYAAAARYLHPAPR